MDWLLHNWVWIGAVGAAVIAVMLCADAFRANKGVGRWKDPYWLGWANVLAYFIHNIEEYGIDINGLSFGFPKTMMEFASSMGVSASSVGMPLEYYAAVNISLVWVAFPLLAYMGKTRPFASAMVAFVLLVNGLMHTVVWFAGIYTSGALTATVLFLPLSIWTIMQVGKEHAKGHVAGYIAKTLGAGLLVHVLLIGSSALFVLAGAAESSALAIVQLCNAAILVVYARFLSKPASSSPMQGALSRR